MPRPAPAAALAAAALLLLALPSARAAAAAGASSAPAPAPAKEEAAAAGAWSGYSPALAFEYNSTAQLAASGKLPEAVSVREGGAHRGARAGGAARRALTLPPFFPPRSPFPTF